MTVDFCTTQKCVCLCAHVKVLFHHFVDSISFSIYAVFPPYRNIWTNESTCPLLSQHTSNAAPAIHFQAFINLVLSQVDIEPSSGASVYVPCVDGSTDSIQQVISGINAYVNPAAAVSSSNTEITSTDAVTVTATVADAESTVGSDAAVAAPPAPQQYVSLADTTQLVAALMKDPRSSLWGCDISFQGELCTFVVGVFRKCMFCWLILLVETWKLCLVFHHTEVCLVS